MRKSKILEKKVSYCCSHNCHWSWYCIVSYHIWVFQTYFPVVSFSFAIFTSFTHRSLAIFCLHFGLTYFDMPLKHRTFKRLVAYVSQAHAYMKLLTLKLKFTSSYFIFRRRDKRHCTIKYCVDTILYIYRSLLSQVLFLLMSFFILFHMIVDSIKELE